MKHWLFGGCARHFQTHPYRKIQQQPQYSLTVRLEQVDTNKYGGTGEMTLNPVLALYLS